MISACFREARGLRAFSTIVTNDIRCGGVDHIGDGNLKRVPLRRMYRFRAQITTRKLRVFMARSRDRSSTNVAAKNHGTRPRTFRGSGSSHVYDVEETSAHIVTLCLPTCVVVAAYE